VMGLAKTRDELTQQIAALEGVLAHSPHLAQAGEILVKLKDALKERA